MGDEKLEDGGGEAFGGGPDGEAVHVCLRVRLQPHQHCPRCTPLRVEGASRHDVVDGWVHTLQHVDMEAVVDDLVDPGEVDGLAGLEDLLGLEGLGAPVLPLREEVSGLQLQVLRELGGDNGQP